MTYKMHALALLILTTLSCNRSIMLTDPDCKHIDVSFVSASKEPIINVEIEGHTYPCLLDLGSNIGDIILRSEIINQIKLKEFKCTTKSRDISGNSYLLNEFLIPLLQINTMEFKNPIILEENTQFLHNTILYPNSYSKNIIDNNLEYSGRLGIELFKPYVCLFDFPRSTVHLFNVIPKNIAEQWAETRLIKTDGGHALICFETDLGLKTFLLDTGANTCSFRESLVDKLTLARKNTVKQSSSGRWFFRSLKMRTGNIDLGEHRFILFEFQKPFDQIDGILGMDFFQKHPICLDFPNSKAYISPPKKNFWKKILNQLLVEDF